MGVKIGKSYKIDEDIYGDVQKICKALSKDGYKINPSSIAENAIIKFWEDNKKVLEGGK